MVKKEAPDWSEVISRAKKVLDGGDVEAEMRNLAEAVYGALTDPWVAGFVVEMLGITTAAGKRVSLLDMQRILRTSSRWSSQPDERLYLCGRGTLVGSIRETRRAKNEDEAEIKFSTLRDEYSINKITREGKSGSLIIPEYTFWGERILGQNDFIVDYAKSGGRIGASFAELVEKALEKLESQTGISVVDGKEGVIEELRAKTAAILAALK